MWNANVYRGLVGSADGSGDWRRRMGRCRIPLRQDDVAGDRFRAHFTRSCGYGRQIHLHARPPEHSRKTIRASRSRAAPITVSRAERHPSPLALSRRTSSSTAASTPRRITAGTGAYLRRRGAHQEPGALADGCAGGLGGRRFVGVVRAQPRGTDPDRSTPARRRRWVAHAILTHPQVDNDAPLQRSIREAARVVSFLPFSASRKRPPLAMAKASMGRVPA